MSQRAIFGPAGPDGSIGRGLSGTGFKIGPAVGRLDGGSRSYGQATTVDISAFRPDRFDLREFLKGDHAYQSMWSSDYRDDLWISLGERSMTADRCWLSQGGHSDYSGCVLNARCIRHRNGTGPPVIIVQGTKQAPYLAHSRNSWSRTLGPAGNTMKLHQPGVGCRVERDHCGRSRALSPVGRGLAAGSHIMHPLIRTHCGRMGVLKKSPIRINRLHPRWNWPMKRFLSLSSRPPIT